MANAGALGMLGVTYLGPEALRSAIRRTAELTNRPFGVNLLLRWEQYQRLEISLEEGVRWGVAGSSPIVHDADRERLRFLGG